MLLQCSFYSCTLKSNTTVQILLPSATVNDSLQQDWMPYQEPPRRFPVLYLLHGAFDDANAWKENTNICRYAQDRGLAVVMPSAGNSFYQNMAHGPAVSDFLAQELPRLVTAYFPVSQNPRETYIAGNSMGGYGALYTALTYPERYAAAASLSGALVIEHAMSEAYGGLIPVRAEDVFAKPKQLTGSEYDLFALCEKQQKKENALPALYMSCGTEDFLIEDNRSAKACFEALGMHPYYTEAPGVHGWKYWEEHTCEMLDWMLSPSRPAKTMATGGKGCTNAENTLV